MVESVNTDNFEDKVLSGSEIKIVKFGASWCGPCRTMEPMFDDLAKKYKQDPSLGVEIYSVDVDDPSSALLNEQYSISSIPAIFAIRDGKVISNKVGSMTHSQLESWINEMLKK